MLDIKTTVGKSKIQGQGLFALEDFKPGDIVVAWDTSNTLTDEQYGRLPEDQRRYVVRYEAGWLYMVGPGRSINHSCDPNTVPLRGNDVAIRDIHAGDEITSDYRPVMPIGERMECHCGTSECKGFIEGMARQRMDQVTFAWTILTTLFAGTQLFAQRVIAKEGRDGAFAGFLMYAVSFVLALALLFTIEEIPAAWGLAVLCGVVSGAVHGFGNYLRIQALKDIDSVLYFPINKVLGPIIVVLGGVWLFSESLALREYLGIAFSLSVPLLLVSSTEHLRQNNLSRGLSLMVVSTVLTSIAMLLSKQGTLYDADILVLLLATQAAGTVSSAAIFWKQARERNAWFPHLDKRDVYLGIIVGILGFLSYYTFLRALSTGYVSLVYVIHAHYILIPIVLSVWWYREHINLRKLVAVVVSCLAIGLLYSP